MGYLLLHKPVSVDADDMRLGVQCERAGMEGWGVGVRLLVIIYTFQTNGQKLGPHLRNKNC